MLSNLCQSLLYKQDVKLSHHFCHQGNLCHLHIWHICPTVVKHYCSKLYHITYSVYHHSNNNFTFFGFNPCLKTCSRTIKKCCKGILSESSIRPYFSDVSISSLTISFDMLTKLLLSIITGSRAEIKKKIFLIMHDFMLPTVILYENITITLYKFQDA